jgi:hypothetical protein
MSMITEWLEELGDCLDINFVLMNGFDSCIVGVIDDFSGNKKVCYSYEKVLDKLVDQGMTRDEAVYFHEYNQLGAYVGDNSPCFLHEMDEVVLNEWEHG